MGDLVPCPPSGSAHDLNNKIFARVNQPNSYINQPVKQPNGSENAFLLYFSHYVEYLLQTK